MHGEASNIEQGGRARLERLESGVVLIRLGDPQERVVTLTQERMNSLASIVQAIRKERPRGLIVTGPNREMFTAGADVNILRDVTDAQLAEKLAREGQKIFDEIASLPFPTIAAISGPCVGGGCEMALACTYRIISDHKSSIIGLPEIKLGIIPGFGGTQRLPRLVGLPRALDIILAGKTVRPAQARHIGLVHEVLSADNLIARADAIVSGIVRAAPLKLKFFDRLLTFSRMGRSFVKKRAQQQVRKETKGFYPAPPAALEAAFLGLERGMPAGLEYEAKELGRLLVTSECKSLVKIFFLTESSKAIGKSARKAVEQLSTVVVGAGIMGAGIAGTLARAECSVVLKDTDEAAVQRGLQHVRNMLAKSRHLSDQERSFILNRITPATKEVPSMGSAHLAIEAVFENLEVKKKVLLELAKALPRESILATNTSSLSVTELASFVEGPERVVGMHFFNPVEKMPLVEIVHGSKTSEATIAIIAALATKMGKFPVVVKDVPGFLVNRVLTPYLNEAAHLLVEGYSAQVIDAAATGFGMPMGPLRLLDEVGLDVAAHVSEIMVKGYGERMKGPGLAALLVAAGRKGKKSGGGFYDFQEGKETPYPQLRAILKIDRAAAPTDALTTITNRLVMSLINEAVRCLDEGVAGRPGPEAADQINLATVMGMGFPPFRGGLLHYANALGAKSILQTIDALTKGSPHIVAAEGIRRRAETGKDFYSA